MNSPLVFSRDGRVLPYVPVTLASIGAMHAQSDIPREGGQKRNYPIALATYMALLVLANENRSDRTAISQGDLAAKAGTSRESVQRALGDLVEAGVVVLHKRSHSGLRIEHEYVVVEPPDTRIPAEGDAASHRRNPSEKPSSMRQTDASMRQTDADVASHGRSYLKEEEEKEAVDEREVVVARDADVISLNPSSVADDVQSYSFSGKQVPAEHRRMAVDVLAVFNEKVGTRLRPFGSRGASVHLTQITGVVLDHPKWPIGHWRRLIDWTVDHPWWGEGTATVGAVFGPAVVEENIERCRQRERPSARTNGSPAANGDLIRDLLQAGGEL